MSGLEEKSPVAVSSQAASLPGSDVPDAGSIHPDFRLFITTEPHPDFPISLLQSSIKVTNEPPNGLKAGLYRSYTSVVDSERLQRVETREWRDLVYAVCFMHSAVQERRKFGPVGWCIPYEFNTSDLEASLTFLEKILLTSTTSQGTTGISWPTLQYMICEIQYGGRVTDEMDRLLLNTCGRSWVTPRVFESDFQFGPPVQTANGPFKYVVPNTDSIDGYRAYIAQIPTHDSPEIFGLHGNAELTLGTTEARYILNTISDTQPKDAQSSLKGGVAKTREEIVFEKADELLAMMPPGYKDEEVREMIRRRPKSEIEAVLGYKPEEKVDGFSIPLNIFLYQEIQRLNATIHRVRKTLQDLKLAINGEIILTPELQDSLNAIFDSKPPPHWYLDASGEFIAWPLPSLGLWFTGLLDREKQLTSWLTTQRPVAFWLTGFFNPQGFLTATRQEITRRHKADRWALDDVVITTEVTDLDLKRIKSGPEEGVYIYGLFLEGCAWDRRSRVLTESAPKELFTPMPIIHISAVNSDRAAKMYSSSAESHIKFYDCPVYTRPRRTNQAFVFNVKLRTFEDPKHWIMRSAALLCSKE